ncbi:diguanylate cyclase [Synechococcus sp. RSCCF101]|uniref:sensor domain-containing diguanylate cyclase n=1 Tax=Synechococcus sp. RSCCF101 TaxID=2511069 RepID=UPI00124542D4|nr:diguanylate cyclase [Synechococcus sp. RSCCF101]QEY31293.1 diguanylate cyclase [Synechococcus sp. RSCCF101]
MKAPLPANESDRLNALRRLKILDTPLDERFERITRMVCRSLQVPVAAVSLVDEQRQWFKSIQGLPVAETSRDVAFCAHAILGDSMMVVPDARKDPRFADNPLVTGEPGIRFYAGYPLKLSDTIKLGTLCAIGWEPREMPDCDRQLLEDLGKTVESELQALALSHQQSEVIDELNELARQALVDPLTRLWNREGLNRMLHKEWDYAIRKQNSLALAMIDCDGFKQINDRHGHLIGDAYLRQLAGILLSRLRPYDTIGRWGGDEFMVIMPATTADEGLSVMQRLLATIADRTIDTEAGPIQPRVTIGAAAAIPDPGSSAQALLGTADDVLIALKQRAKGTAAVHRV